ncbi:MAG: DNA polymerase A family protein, partial [Actinomycetota bacterium]
VNHPEYWEYAALDTAITARLAEELWPRTKPYREAYELELAVTWVLLDMETRGMKVDVEYCERERVRLLDELEVIERRWPNLNLHSSDQVSDFLQAEGVALTHRTASGDAYSLTADVLAQVEHPIAEDVAQARERRKVVGTYLDNYLEYEVDGLLHCNINPLGAEKTGRMSISRPSFQNIPRTKLARSAITARPGNKLLLIDYQAQETRLVAHFANDPELLRAFAEDLDVHTYVASLIYGVPMEDVLPEQRRKAKQGGHARNYGAGASKVALTVDVSVPEATAFVRAYDAKFKNIPELHRKLARTLKERAVNGWSYVRTYGGRDVKVPMKKSYVGMNYLIQGSGSDVLKRGMVNADRNGVGQYLVLPVHDETL